MITHSQEISEAFTWTVQPGQRRTCTFQPHPLIQRTPRLHLNHLQTRKLTLLQTLCNSSSQVSLFLSTQKKNHSILLSNKTKNKKRYTFILFCCASPRKRRKNLLYYVVFLLDRTSCSELQLLKTTHLQSEILTLPLSDLLTKEDSKFELPFLFFKLVLFPRSLESFSFKQRRPNSHLYMCFLVQEPFQQCILHFRTLGKLFLLFSREFRNLNEKKEQRKKKVFLSLSLITVCFSHDDFLSGISFQKISQTSFDDILGKLLNFVLKVKVNRLCKVKWIY